ncbi:hypothetical protein CEXT_503591 [Caerostris extrusa]|uniref:Uncharacterized protein n=1 Tax=Caerostris extrusa TaxID=172846 RepID=A0AAV4TYV2_CAEEX|nr:hypothetical protein CEXT_503591 [Caerostris extrusa]
MYIQYTFYPLYDQDTEIYVLSSQQVQIKSRKRIPSFSLQHSSWGKVSRGPPEPISLWEGPHIRGEGVTECSNLWCALFICAAIITAWARATAVKTFSPFRMLISACVCGICLGSGTHCSFV